MFATISSSFKEAYEQKMTAQLILWETQWTQRRENRESMQRIRPAFDRAWRALLRLQQTASSQQDSVGHQARALEQAADDLACALHGAQEPNVNA